MLKIALPSGRMMKQVLAMLTAVGYKAPTVEDIGRKLFFDDPAHGIRYLVVKPSDLPVYVYRGAADLGVAGYDVLHEERPDVLELLDLGIGKCRMCVAAMKDYTPDTTRPIRVATKFVNTAKRHYRHHAGGVEIIKLNGAVELAPVLAMSDVIVDIVETGTTLVENNLEILETIFPISSRLIANRAAYQFKRDEIVPLVEGLRGNLGDVM